MATGRRRKVGKVSLSKIEALVVSAVRHLTERKGSTLREITGRVSFVVNLPETRIAKKVKSVLDYGLKHGIFRRRRDRYSLLAGDKPRKIRRDVRFARLPTPAPSEWRTRAAVARRRDATPSQRDSGAQSLSSFSHGIHKRRRRFDFGKDPKRSRSLPSSDTSSHTDRSNYRNDGASTGTD